MPSSHPRRIRHGIAWVTLPPPMRWALQVRKLREENANLTANLAGIIQSGEVPDASGEGLSKATTPSPRLPDPPRTESRQPGTSRSPTPAHGAV